MLRQSDGVCRSGVPSSSTIDKTMKMLGAKAFWVVFQKRTRSKDEVQKDKVGKFEVKKVKNKGAVSKNAVRVAICPHCP